MKIALAWPWMFSLYDPVILVVTWATNRQMTIEEFYDIFYVSCPSKNVKFQLDLIIFNVFMLFCVLVLMTLLSIYKYQIYITFTIIKLFSRPNTHQNKNANHALELKMTINSLILLVVTVIHCVALALYATENATGLMLWFFSGDIVTWSNVYVLLAMSRQVRQLVIKRRKS